MFEAEQFRPQPETPTLPTVWASVISVGLHGLIWFIQPVLPFTKQEKFDTQRTVAIVELTPAEISRLPEFAPPPLPPPLPAIPPANLLPPLPPLPSTIPVIPIPGQPPPPRLNNNSNQENRTEDNQRKPNSNTDEGKRDRSNNKPNQNNDDVQRDRNNNTQNQTEEKQRDRNNNTQNQTEEKKGDRNNNNQNQTEEKKGDRNNNNQNQTEEKQRDRNNNNQNQTEEKQRDRNNNNQNQTDNNNRNQSDDSRRDRNNNNREPNNDDQRRDRNNSNRNQRNNLSADEQVQRLYGYNPNGTDKADGLGKLSIWIDQNSDKFPIKDIKQEKEPRIVQSPLKVYLPTVNQALIAVLVDPEGKIVGEPELIVKTGYPDHLDPAIIEDAKKRTFEPTGSHIIYVYPATIDQSKLTRLTGRTGNN